MSTETYQPEALGPDEAPPTVQKGAVIGRYVVLQALGAGAAGVVYAAYDSELDRKLALKFLRFRGDPDAVRAAAHRLRREAKTMARLTHPNVVALHDVGKVGGQMFLVMDFVAGGTLRTWFEKERTWKESLDLVCRAGDGLAAAHAAGVVHRDFKPSNVLVDGDRPRVTDFGIAAAERSKEVPEEAARPPGAPSAPPATGEETLQTEGILGTVGYLAPEQAYGHPVDARSDQFSFCVTLYEALYGVLPFPKDDLLTYLNAVGCGAIRRPPPDVRVPKAVHAAIVRGLSAEPEDRFPTMGALLDELRRDPHQPARQRWRIAGAVAAVAVAAIAVVRARAPAAPVCPPPDASLGGAWTPAARDRLADLFARAAPFGASSFAPLARSIDEYAGRVAGMRQEACVAAEVRRTQSESVKTLRLECLDERARELAAYVRLLTGAASDEAVVRSAAESFGKLSPVEPCGDVAALTAPVPPPSRDVSAQVDAARGELAEVRALRSIARYAEAESRAEALVARAQALGYAPLLAEAQYALGSVQFSLTKDDLAAKTLRAAADTAEEGKHDLLRGEAYELLAADVGRRLGHYEAAIALSTTALHVARRIGSELLAAEALEQLGMDHGQVGQADEGLKEAREALAMKERLLGPDRFELATTHVAISVALSEQGRLDEALREDREALAIVEKNQGPGHPHAGIYHGNIAVDLVWSGRAEEAIPEAETAMRIVRESVGTENGDYALELNQKAYALTKLGRFAEARPLNEEAVAITERVGGKDTANVTYPLVGLGEDLVGLGKADEALPLLERATRMAEANELDPETMGECHYHLARAVWLARRDGARAASLARRAAADYARSPRLRARAEAARAFAEEREAKD